ncbi:lipo-like protein [Marinobacter piscensis]|uniref:lipo-like protein n=1 Tax=Marinobacter piscensis TaxID=1562308 RepID=UPI0011A23B98|nr:lipo-like protein [Marinobacter piscensis]
MFLDWLSGHLAAYLSRQVAQHSVPTSTYEALEKVIRPGDILLVEGNTRISVAIKYLTQSTWSHAALYLGPDAGFGTSENGDCHTLVEADLEFGIRTLPLNFYRNSHTRICRPVGLDKGNLHMLTDYALSRLGQRYDMKNVFDLARYLIRTPPVPARHRHKLLSLGSGDPTRAICSTFIAEGFQRLRYPILPTIDSIPADDPNCAHCIREHYRIRQTSLFTPRDFDASPYFRIIKPTLENNFDFRAINWADL